ncbi:MAG: hypothetical protein WED00_13055 [Aquisalimonadaceae bacterium]
MAARDLTAKSGFAAQVHLRIASDHPATAENDERKNMERVLKGAIAAFARTLNLMDGSEGGAVVAFTAGSAAV